MEVVDHLLKVLLRLVLARDIGKADALRGLDVDLGVGFAHAEHHGACAAAGIAHHLFIHVLAEADEDDYRQHPSQQEAEKRRGLLNYLLRELRA